MNFTFGNFICLPIKMTDKWIGDFISTSWAPRPRAHQDPKDFEEPSRVFNPQWAQFLQWLWCHGTIRIRDAHTLRPELFLSQPLGPQHHRGGGSPANSPVVGGGVVTSFLNWMAGRYLLWLLQHSPLPVSLCPLWQEPGQKSLSMLWADTMPMGARPMAREKGFQYWYMSWAQRRFALATGGST